MTSLPLTSRVDKYLLLDVWYVPNEGRLPRHITGTNIQHQLTASV